MAALVLAALLPVMWLVGRRTAPASHASPVLLPLGAEVTMLQPMAPGLAAGVEPVRLPLPRHAVTGYRLGVRPPASDAAPRFPWKIRLEGPRGGDAWNTVLGSLPHAEAGFEIVLPADGLVPGRYAVWVEDAGGTVRGYPFVVP